MNRISLVKMMFLVVGMAALTVACAQETPTLINEAEDSAVDIADGQQDSGINEPIQIGEQTDVDEEAANQAETPTEAPIVIANPDTAGDYDGIPVGFTEDGYPYMGDIDAPIVIEEFSDFECPFCSRFHQQTLPAIISNDIADGNVLFIYRDYPLSIHAQAPAAANAARCAGEQGAAAYWQMHDSIFESLGEWSGAHANDYFIGLAEGDGLDVEAFSKCVTEDRHAAKVQADFQEGAQRGINSTPSFFINNQPFIGAQPLPAFQSAISRAMAGDPIVEARPTSPPQQAPPQGVAPTPVTIQVDDAAYAYGDPDAPIKIVEYTDYQCPFCNRHVQQVFPTMLTEMIESGRVYYQIKDLPLENIHPAARSAHNAARCAGEQDQYVAMHDQLFARQAEWSEGDVDGALTGIAQEIGLEMGQFSECFDGRIYDELVQTNIDEGFSFGIRGTPHFFVDGYPLSGARPIEHFQLAVQMAEEGTLAQAFVPRPTPTPAPIGEVSPEGGYGYGDPSAPVTIIEYTDFQCPFCNRHHQQTFPAIMSNYVETGKVYYVIKDFPLTSIHPQAPLAHEVARCAEDQGKYEAIADMLFDNLQEWNGRGDADVIFKGYAEEVGLDMNVLDECLENQKYRSLVAQNLEEGASLGVRGTPAFFINGVPLSGAQPYQTFVQAIEQALAQSGANQ